MREEMYDLWIIPGQDLEEKGLIDGEALFYKTDGGTGKHHQDLLKKFASEHQIDATYCFSYPDFGNLYTSLGIAFLINAGKIDGKYCIVMYLPANLTEKQITFFEDKKKLFAEKFHENISFFDIAIRKEGELEYRNNGFRNLKIESIIEGNPSENGQELLYRELKRQKEKLTNKSNGK